jgi:hypothetical protein
MIYATFSIIKFLFEVMINKKLFWKRKLTRLSSKYRIRQDEIYPPGKISYALFISVR